MTESKQIDDLTPDEVVARLIARNVIALTLFGEARGDGPEARIAVANVLRNRVEAKRPKQFGETLRDVCVKPAQFSCWRPAGGRENYDVVIATARLLLAGRADGPVLRECLWIADGLIESAFVDNTHGATHYLTAKLYAEDPPAWAVRAGVLARIGSQVFMRSA